MRSTLINAMRRNKIKSNMGSMIATGLLGFGLAKVLGNKNNMKKKSE